MVTTFGVSFVEILRKIMAKFRKTIDMVRGLWYKLYIYRIGGERWESTMTNGYRKRTGHAPKRGRDVDMTEGGITQHIIRFAIPLLIGNVFQQLYNTVDTWVVGNFVSNEAYAAVGSVGPVINMLIGFFMGLSSGAGVVISQYYGAKRYEEVQKTVHTAVVMTLVLGVLFTAVGLGMTPFMLDLMNTPETVVPESTAYLTIYFSGMMGLMLYNIGAGILRAVGDSKRPFLYLAVCAIINTVLDLVFVLVFHMGVQGVALATIIAQATSAVLVLLALLRSDTCIRLRVSALRPHPEVLKKIIAVGIPAAIQMAITSFSNIFVQSYINYFGDNCMSGWTTYSKVDQILFLPMQSIALASTTFVGQNLGCNQVERARQGGQSGTFAGDWRDPAPDGTGAPVRRADRRLLQR